MTEFEYIDATAMALDLARSAGMDFIAVFFAYVVVSYLVGAKIPTFVAGAITVTYTLFAIGPIVAMRFSVTAAFDLAREALVTFPESVFFTSFPLDANPGLFLTAQCLGWLLSVLYLHLYQRRLATDT